MLFNSGKMRVKDFESCVRLYVTMNSPRTGAAKSSIASFIYKPSWVAFQRKTGLFSASGKSPLWYVSHWSCREHEQSLLAPELRTTPLGAMLEPAENTHSRYRRRQPSNSFCWFCTRNSRVWWQLCLVM